jgi:hypothetical protein
MSTYTINSENEFDNFKMSVIANAMQGCPTPVIKDFLSKIHLESFPCFIKGEIDKNGNIVFTFSTMYRLNEDLHFEDENKITLNNAENMYFFGETSLCKKGYEAQSQKNSSVRLSLNSKTGDYDLLQGSSFCKKEKQKNGSCIIKSHSNSFEKTYNAAGVEMFSSSDFREYPDREGTSLGYINDNNIERQTVTTTRRESLLTFSCCTDIYERIINQHGDHVSTKISGYRLKDTQYGIEGRTRFIPLDNQSELYESISQDKIMSESDVRSCLAGTSPEASEFLLSTYYPYMSDSMKR